MYRKLVIDFNKVYQSNTCGPFQIIEDLGRDDRSRRWVKIRFLGTGFETDVRYDIAMDGKVRDDMFGLNLFETRYSNNFGPYQIIAYLGRNEHSDRFVRIKFLETGYETDVSADLVRLGSVRDKTVKFEKRKSMPTSIEDYDKRIRQILRGRWGSMMSRCYKPDSPSYSTYGAVGVTVCEDWHDFENYYNSMPYIKNYEKFYNNPALYNLDKDFLQQNIPPNQRIYSPQTCVFLNLFDNSNLAMKESNPNGYYGVRTTKNGTYNVTFSVNGTKYHFGTYTNLIAALNEYNYYYLVLGRFELVPLLNNVEFMPHYQALKYLVTK